MQRNQVWLMLSLAAGIVLSPSSTYASESLLGFWAVGFGNSSVSTEFSLFNTQPEEMGIDLTFFDDAENTIIMLNAVLTPFEERHFDVRSLVAGTNASAGLFLVTAPTTNALRGTVIMGLTPAGGVGGKAGLLLDQDAAITAARGLTGSTMRPLQDAAETLVAPLGLTTLSPVRGDGFQTFLVFANVGTSPQFVEIEYFGDNEIFLGSCGLLLTSFDLVITRPGLPGLGSPCSANLAPALVAPDRTTARWAASIQTNPSHEVLLGEVVVINTRTSEAFVYEMR
ncbi:MAG: hypothetical protein HY278_04730 [candidate division NC10 bacterium]|nr:hypothetical protein [candidate division NC10 bacterium]